MKRFLIILLFVLVLVNVTAISATDTTKIQDNENIGLNTTISNDSDNLIPIDEEDYINEELEIIKQRELDYENFTTDVTSNKTNNGVEINNTLTVIVNYDFQNASNLTKWYGENQTFKGFVELTNLSENVVHIEILVSISRLSNGANKLYHIPVNWDGYFEIPINLAPGNYHVIIPSFFNIGGGILLTNPVYFYNIFILDPNVNKTQTFLDYDENSFSYGFKGQKLVGTLKTQDDKFLSGQLVEVHITRNTNGASKTYFVTTNDNGEYSLPINLAEEGSYTFRCSYKGTSEYESSNYMLTKSFNSFR